MEKIKRTIKQALTTGTTESSTGNTFVIIPDLNAEYSMNLLLTSRALDLGFFDAFEESNVYIFGISEPIGIQNLL